MDRQTARAYKRGWRDHLHIDAPGRHGEELLGGDIGRAPKWSRGTMTSVDELAALVAEAHARWTSLVVESVLGSSEPVAVAEILEGAIAARWGSPSPEPCSTSRVSGSSPVSSWPTPVQWSPRCTGPTTSPATTSPPSSWCRPNSPPVGYRHRLRLPGRSDSAKAG